MQDLKPVKVTKQILFEGLLKVRADLIRASAAFSRQVFEAYECETGLSLPADSAPFTLGLQLTKGEDGAIEGITIVPQADAPPAAPDLPHEPSEGVAAGAQ